MSKLSVSCHIREQNENISIPVTPPSPLLNLVNDVGGGELTHVDCLLNTSLV